MQVSTIGVDLAKNVFQVHGVDSAGKVVITRQLRRKQIIDFFSKIPSCLVGMEACGTAHYWAREIAKLGHAVRLMPPSYVKGYVKRSKNDAADAAAICEAVTRPSMRFVPIKSADQQALLMLHRSRDLLMRQRTQLINALRAHLAEFGLVAEIGREGLAQLAEIVTDESNREALPSAMRQALQAIVDQLVTLELQIGSLDRAIHAHHRANDMSCRLATVPGIGVIGATAVASTVTDPSNFKSGRDFAAWIGLVPRQHSTGGKERLTAEAIVGTTVRVIKRQTLEGVAAKDVRVAHNLLNLATKNLEHAENQMMLLGRKTSHERVAAFLLEMDSRLSATGVLDLPMTRRDIADYLGLTIETVSRELSRLCACGILAFPEDSQKKVFLIDRGELQKLTLNQPLSH